MRSQCFGWALAQLKDGFKVAREGWNGKGMWLILVKGTPQVNTNKDSAYHNAGVLSVTINPHIDMMTATEEMQPGWLASQTDMLAEDWVIVD